MKIQIHSDLHLEHFPDRGRKFLNKFPVEAEVLVLAGDICQARSLDFDKLSEKFKHVIYVAGNHEYYDSIKEAAEDNIRKKLKPNVHWLNNNSVEIEEQRFVGGTLWFTAPNRNYTNDFLLIYGLKKWILQEENACKELLKTVNDNDIVVTHYLPHENSIAAVYKGMKMNECFLNDCSSIIRENKPKLWIHGHTHTACDYVIDSTRVVCNPLGYRNELNKFNIVTVEV